MRSAWERGDDVGEMMLGLKGVYRTASANVLHECRRRPLDDRLSVCLSIMSTTRRTFSRLSKV